jgi:hypothetical protein
MLTHRSPAAPGGDRRTTTPRQGASLIHNYNSHIPRIFITYRYGSSRRRDGPEGGRP